MRSRRVDCDLMKANVGLGRITDIYEEGSKLSKSLESLLRLAEIWKLRSGNLRVARRGRYIKEGTGVVLGGWIGLALSQGVPKASPES